MHRLEIKCVCNYLYNTAFEFVSLIFHEPNLHTVHYIQPIVFGICTSKSSSVRQSGLCAADVQDSFLFRLVACQRGG